MPAFAAALRRSCREEDFVARMGDRFVLVLTNFRERHLAEKGKQIEQLAGSEVKIGAAFSPGDGAYADDLLAAADARMNQPDGEVV